MTSERNVGFSGRFISEFIIWLETVRGKGGAHNGNVRKLEIVYLEGALGAFRSNILPYTNMFVARK